MNRAIIEEDLRNRAKHYSPQTHLEVNYYRIRRRLAYPLPVRKLLLPELPVPGIPVYPWATWMLWALEERVHSLGWAAEWSGDSALQDLVLRDLKALAVWPSFRQYENPDLSLGHSCRLLWLALKRWEWAGVLRPDIALAFERVLEENAHCWDPAKGGPDTAEAILRLAPSERGLANIPLIGTTGLALAAHTVGHHASEFLDRRLRAVLGATLELRRTGHAEGVAYDGYILDFVAHWLEEIPEEDRNPILDHPEFAGMLDESIHLAAPGNLSNVARIGDVEPEEMPFHLSAHAKLLRLRPSARSVWLLNRCMPGRLRADALGEFHSHVDGAVESAPEAAPADAGYALSLRSGWEEQDLCAVVSASSSPMGHLPLDGGTLVIGTCGRWLLDDPGYQQYMQKTERVFTLGPKAHNAPLLNGQAQNRRFAFRDFDLEDSGKGCFRASVNLLHGYPEDLQLELARRTVWLCERDLIVVADQIRGVGVREMDYCWHGHPEAAWWVADNRARLYFPEATLWISSPQTLINGTCLDRLPGSRGHLTLQAAVEKPLPAAVWWVFSLGAEPPAIRLSDDGQALQCSGSCFEVHGK